MTATSRVGRAWANRLDGGRLSPADAPLRQLAHDLAVEISTIRLLAESVTADPSVTGLARHRIEQILSEAEAALEMLRRPLELDPSEPQADLAAVAHEVARTSALLPGARVTLCPMPQGTVRLEYQALRRALMNLVENAARAAGPEGNVMLRARSQGACVRVEVIDSGPGFGHIRGGRARLGLASVRSALSRVGGYLETGRDASGRTVVAMVIPWLVAKASTEEAS